MEEKSCFSYRHFKRTNFSAVIAIPQNRDIFRFIIPTESHTCPCLAQTCLQIAPVIGLCMKLDHLTFICVTAHIITNDGKLITSFQSWARFF